MKKIALLLVVASLFIASPVMANDGNDLLNKCGEVIKLINKEDASSVSFTKAEHCYGLLIGTVETHELLSKHNNSENFFCLSSGVTNNQAIMVIVKYLKEHPEILHRSASTLILLALQKKFPCPEHQPSK